MNSRIGFLHLRFIKLEKYHGVHTITCQHLNSVEATMILEMVKDNPSVEELSMTGDDLSQIDEELLSVAVSKLRCVSLIGTHLTMEQLTSVITAATTSSITESLNLSRNNLTLLPPRLLVRAVSSLAALALESSCLTRGQCKEVIIAGEGGSNIT